MKILARLLVTSTLALAAVAGTAGAPSAAVAVAAAPSSPWAVTTFIRGGQPVGNIEHYCDGSDVTYGDTTNYDYTHFATFYMCP